MLASETRKSSLAAIPRPVLAGEDFQIEGIGHRLVAGVIGVQVIARIELRAEPLGIGGVACRRFEIDHRVERAGRADPRIQRRADLLAILASVASTLERCQSAADYLDAMRVGLRDELLVAADQFVGGDCLPRNHRSAADVVDALHQRHPLDPRLAEHIAIEARQALAPAPSRRTRLPPIPRLATAMFAVALLAARRAASRAGQL